MMMKNPKCGCSVTWRVASVLASLAISQSATPARAESPDGSAPTERSAIYSPYGKRDPFRAPALNSTARDGASLNPLEQWALEQLQLRAILKGLGKPRAMFEDPEGKTHIVGEGDLIGRERGTVSRIESADVIVTQRTFNYLGAESLIEKVLSLPKEPGLEQALPMSTGSSGDKNGTGKTGG